MTIRVLLADDQPLLRRGFTMILDAEPDISVVAEAGDGAEAAALVDRHRPDVVLMDIRMPHADGIDATRRILVEHPDVRVVILTTFDLDEYAYAALRAGASGFLLKNTHPRELVASIRAVAGGDAVIAPSTTRRLLDAFATTAPAPSNPANDALAALTPREREVFAAVAAGHSNHEIADRLTLSETTVKTHVASVLAKLGLRDRIQLVIYHYEHDLGDHARRRR